MAIDPATGLPLELITPNPGAAPPGFVPQFQDQPLPGTAPVPGAELPPGFTAAPPQPALAPVPNLYQPLPAPPQAAPAQPQTPAAAPAPHSGSHAQPGMVQQFDKLINQSQTAQSDAAGNLAQVQQQGGADTAQAIAEKAATQQRLAGELAAKQKEVQAHNQALDAIDAANLKKAKDATIPDFWQGRTGALVASTIAVGLTGIGAGLLGSTKNTTQEAIQHNIDGYFHNQKERIDNLYKYAEDQGKLDAQTRLNYAQDLLNLKDQHSYVLQSAADKVNEIAAKSKGAVDAATTNNIASALTKEASQGFLASRKLRSDMMLQQSQSNMYNAAAAEHRARAANGGYFTPQQQIQMLKFADAGFKPFHDEAIGKGAQPGPVTKLAAVEEVKHSFKDAMASNDPNRISAAVTEVIEKVGPLLAGGKTTGNLTKMVKDMNTLGGQIQGKIGQMTGGNPVGQEYAARLLGLLDSSAHEAKGLANDVFQRATQEHLGPGGHANTPELKKRFLSNARGTFGTATYEGQPIFNIPDENGVFSPSQPAPAPAAAPAIPVGTRATSGGKPIVMGQNGWELAK